MLHWYSWWNHFTRGANPQSAPSPNDPEPWDHENAVRLQTRFWEQWLDAQRTWWTMAAGHIPTINSPMVAATKPPRRSEPAGTASPETKAPAKHPPGIQRRWPEVSGPAAAKLRAQRKRAGLKPKEVPPH
jgi:hypothetical protein